MAVNRELLTLQLRPPQTAGLREAEMRAIMDSMHEAVRKLGRPVSTAGLFSACVSFQAMLIIDIHELTPDELTIEQREGIFRVMRRALDMLHTATRSGNPRVTIQAIIPANGEMRDPLEKQ